MPPSAGTRGLTAEQKILYQKERNKLKQRTLRARRKAAKESELDGIAAAAGDDSILIASSTSTASSSSTPSSSTTTKRVGKVFVSGLEPGEGGLMMKARRAVELKAEEEEQERRRCEREGAGGGGEGSGRSSSESESSRSGMKASPISSTAPRGSDSVPSSKSKSKLTSVSLFATLLNGGSLPPPGPSTNASPPSQLPLTLPSFVTASSSSSTNNHYQLALQRPSSQPTLPSYTYFSPANIGSFPLFNPLNSIDWKWRLFQIHSSLYEDRDHPTKGYLHSRFADETIATAQTLILQLLAATSPPGRKEILDARRTLSPADEQFLKVTPMDRRIGWMPDPLVRVNAMKAISCGLDFTEKAAAGIETATIFGDAMDSGAWMLQNKVALDTRNLYLIPSIDEAGCERNPSLLPEGSSGKKLHGASVREIVLGLELPGARTDQPLTQPASMTDEELAKDWSLDWVMGKKMEGVLKTTFQF